MHGGLGLAKVSAGGCVDKIELIGENVRVRLDSVPGTTFFDCRDWIKKHLQLDLYDSTRLQHFQHFPPRQDNVEEQSSAVLIVFRQAKQAASFMKHIQKSAHQLFTDADDQKVLKAGFSTSKERRRGRCLTLTVPNDQVKVQDVTRILESASVASSLLNIEVLRTMRSVSQVRIQNLPGNMSHSIWIKNLLDPVDIKLAGNLFFLSIPSFCLHSFSSCTTFKSSNTEIEVQRD